MTIDFSNLYSLINPAYHDYLEDYRRVQIFKGGASAGKSVFISQRTIYNFLMYPGYNVIVIRKINADNHDSTFSELSKVINDWSLESAVHINKAKGQEEFYCKHNKNKIIFRGLDDVEKIKSVTFETGPAVLIWVEEASQITEDDYNQLTLRLRGLSKIPKHIVLSFNPIDSRHWIKKRFFDYKLIEQDGFICETTYKDNAFLTTADIQVIESYKDIDWYYYQVYALNQWGDRTNTAVFNNIVVWDFDMLEHYYDSIRHGLDFGFNHANALMGCGWKDGELYLFKEFWKKRYTTTQFITYVEERGDFDKDYPITADSEDPGSIAEFYNAGFKCYPAKKGPGSLIKGVKYLARLPKINIHKTNCPNAVNEFLNFKYKQERDGYIHDEKVVELNDDTIAATRYASEDYFIHGGKVKSGFNKGIYGKRRSA
jgi:phage terminase large subunit